MATDWGAVQARRRRIVFSYPSGGAAQREDGDFGAPLSAPGRLMTLLADADEIDASLVLPAGGKLRRLRQQGSWGQWGSGSGGGGRQQY